MNIKTVEDLFIHLLSDTYSAEKQLTKALSKLARATSNEKLSQAFQSHLEETQGQIERIDQIVESESGIKLKRMKCVAMEGLIEEANEVIESTEKTKYAMQRLSPRRKKSSITKSPATARLPPWPSSLAIAKH